MDGRGVGKRKQHCDLHVGRRVARPLSGPFNPNLRLDQTQQSTVSSGYEHGVRWQDTDTCLFVLRTAPLRVARCSRWPYPFSSQGEVVRDHCVEYSVKVECECE